jgi:predicted RNA binding protein YcfA (HicA-like mRNA interferase family)
MPIRGLSFRQVASKLRKAGFTEVSQKGSHVKFAKQTEEGTLTATVPKHDEIALGTMKSILRQTGISEEAFEKL